MPKEVFGDDFVFLPKNELLTFDEMARIAKGICRIRCKKNTHYRWRTIDATGFRCTYS